MKTELHNLRVEVRDCDIAEVIANGQGGEEAIRCALTSAYAVAGWEWIVQKTQVKFHSQQGEVHRGKLHPYAVAFIRSFGDRRPHPFTFYMWMEMPAGFKVGPK